MVKSLPPLHSHKKFPVYAPDEYTLVFALTLWLVSPACCCLPSSPRRGALCRGVSWSRARLVDLVSQNSIARRKTDTDRGRQRDMARPTHSINSSPSPIVPVDIRSKSCPPLYFVDYLFLLIPVRVYACVLYIYIYYTYVHIYIYIYIYIIHMSCAFASVGGGTMFKRTCKQGCRTFTHPCASTLPKISQSRSRQRMRKWNSEA